MDTRCPLKPHLPVLHPELEVKHGKATFFGDDKMVYLVDGIMPGSKIKGIIYRFQGTGAVDWVKLSKGDGERVYDEEF